MLNTLTIKQAAEGLRAKKFTAVELTKACLVRIEERNEELNAFISVNAEYALEAARRADERLAAGDNITMLTGIPYSVKDAICTKDLRSTGAGQILDNYIPSFQATVIDKLEQAGAVMLGKTNCDAFGHGASNENSMYGPVKHHLDQTKVSGGSSGGSAVSVADDMCIFSIAEDTGGSIRQPAAFCGIAGLRASYGRNSRYGIMPMASSFDTVGPMAKTTEDLAYIMEVMAGHDEKDATTVEEAVPTYSKELSSGIQGLKIGIPKEYFEIEGMQKEVREKIEEQLETLKKLGAELVPVSLPYTKYAISVYYILVPSEDSSNMARLDGIRYGVRSEGDSLIDVYANSRAHGFPEEVKRRIMVGTYALSAGYYDSYYRKAQKVRTKIIQDFDRVFDEVDVLVTPTSPFTAFGIGEKKDDTISMYLADVFAAPPAIAGLPALSVDAGADASGLPIGLQIIGPRLSEEVLFRVGHTLEKA
ncbi:Asp-tRNA(Asn)/Glu-tRNA(Gln) amidotransferase subunit GatA [Patescibacteria group bacterium]|nr:Asp-tRNA(Asn)/Glu-tRNA(Gln) amidotransferase subunit GatA [Patescibacteria group bacterium]MBU1721389.1 Asp-tRNA(Asn)/Glu-tRNA(Gln) amidotransferase subunit GatA [Patescibacteria group bacterium]MBU1900757.1 Asp-tRNA(Asn)/Glu-tRNA(Gln) amidotransferase subunit GatA [Patescibacteria group bacterium]